MFLACHVILENHMTIDLIEMKISTKVKSNCKGNCKPLSVSRKGKNSFFIICNSKTIGWLPNPAWNSNNQLLLQPHLKVIKIWIWKLQSLLVSRVINLSVFPLIRTSNLHFVLMLPCASLVLVCEDQI